MMLQVTVVRLRRVFQIHRQAGPPQTQHAAIGVECRIAPLVPMEFKKEETYQDGLKEETHPQQRNLIAIVQARWRLCTRPPLTIFSLFATSTRKSPNRHRS